MAGSARYTAVLDANVLYSNLLRDTLLSLATADLYHAQWTVDIQDEWTRNLARNRPDIAHRLPDLVALMNTAVPDCLVTGYEKLIDCIVLPDPTDRHVVAAAITGHADAIVTFNKKDFPLEVLAPYGIELQDPDEFLTNQLQLHPMVALGAINRMRGRWKVKRTPQEMIEGYRQAGLLLTADMLTDPDFFQALA
ncbi:PIN domain-containing protein [Polaromonas aquatica]|uniref:Toxin-antitoxin system toxin component, PIN family n=1 Tax=Polaromonas aquatica TaxID=332657 RepID=A0ABW1U038_9BURK